MFDIDKLKKDIESEKMRLEKLIDLATKLEDVEKMLCDFGKKSIPTISLLNLGVCWYDFSDEEKAEIIKIIRRYRVGLEEKIKSEVEKCLTSNHP